jgi:hypothetical protein
MSSDKANEIREGFIRQRRNLILISVVLFFFGVAGIRLDSVNLLGNKFILGEPGMMTVALWVVWGYWLVRYWQYYNETGDKGYLAYWYAAMDSYVVAKGRKLLAEEDWARQIELNPRFLEAEVIARASPFHDGVWGVRFRPDESLLDTTEEEFLKLQKDSPTLGTYGLDPRSLLWLQIRAWLNVLFVSRLGTEYLLPFAVATIPAALALYRLAAVPV